MKGLRESSVRLCDVPGILCSVSTLSKWILTNSMEFKRKPVSRKGLGSCDLTHSSVLLSWPRWEPNSAREALAMTKTPKLACRS